VLVEYMLRSLQSGYPNGLTFDKSDLGPQSNDHAYSNTVSANQYTDSS